MSVHLRHLLMEELGALRYEPTEKRIRGILGGETVVDSVRALLVWEPKRVVPTYAVPVEDILGEVDAAPVGGKDESAGLAAIAVPFMGDRPVLDPSIPFSVHTTDGELLTLRARGSDREAAALRPSDTDLSGFVIVDFSAFDAWYEEDEINTGHPRDPFHRIDIVRSSRHVRVELGGELLAESSRPFLLFEPPLPLRYYLPLEDVRADLLRPSETTSTCAYKGEATYWSTETADDVAWSYPHPLREAAEVTGAIAFFNEVVDLVVDGVRVERPVTPWSRR